MSRPRFLADEDWRYEIVLAVRRAEPAVEIETVVGIGRAGIADEEVLEYAHANGFLLLSHDVNTLKAEAVRRIANGRSVSGVFLAAQRTPTRVLAESILAIWGASEADEWKDRIVFLPI